MYDKPQVRLAWGVFRTPWTLTTTPLLMVLVFVDPFWPSGKPCSVPAVLLCLPCPVLVAVPASPPWGCSKGRH